MWNSQDDASLTTKISLHCGPNYKIFTFCSHNQYARIYRTCQINYFELPNWYSATIIGCEKEASQECQIYTNMALRNIIVLLRLQWCQFTFYSTFQLFLSLENNGFFFFFFKWVGSKGSSCTKLQMFHSDEHMIDMCKILGHIPIIALVTA